MTYKKIYVTSGNAEYLHDETGNRRYQPVATMPGRDSAKPSEQQGLFRKFDVRRVDGSDQPEGKHHNCEYFVLDTSHDQHARAALQAYAIACASTHPALSADLIARYELASVNSPAPRTDALSADGRQALGEGLTEYFSALDRGIGTDTPDRILCLFDYHDARNVNDLIDRAILPVLDAPPVELPAAAPRHLKAQLRRVMDLLDTHLGDSDTMLTGMTQEEIEEEFPVVAAMQIVVGLHQEIPEVGTITAAPAAVVTSAPRAYPDELTDTLRHVLGFPNFRCAPYAHLMRDAGADVKSRSEDEQAHVLHWLVKLVLDHGERWADVAEEELNLMRHEAEAARAGDGR